MALPPAEPSGSAPWRSQRSEWTIIKIVDGPRKALQFHQPISSFFSILLEACQQLEGWAKEEELSEQKEPPLPSSSSFRGSRRDPGNRPHVVSGV